MSLVAEGLVSSLDVDINRLSCEGIPESNQGKVTGEYNIGYIAF